MADQMTETTTQSSQEQNEPHLTDSSFTGASQCESCAAIAEFDLPANEGLFEIACYECDHIYEIDAKQALQEAALQSMSDKLEGFDDLDQDGPANTKMSALIEDIDPNEPTRFDLPAVALPQKGGKTSIILVSILSAGLVITASMVALGLYFLTLRTDSDVTRYIETTILQLAPAKFEVQNASYEISESDIGTSLLVTVTISNTGQIEGAPDEMKVVLTDANNQPLVTWPLDIAGQLIAPGEATQLYTRLFEPPADFANLRVFVR